MDRDKYQAMVSLSMVVLESNKKSKANQYKVLLYKLVSSLVHNPATHKMLM